MILKKHIAQELNKRHKELDYKLSNDIVTDVFDILTDNIYNSKKVMITGFMKFWIDIQKGKKYYNTQESKVKTAEVRWVLHKKISKSLNDRLKAKPVYYEDDFKQGII